MLNDKVENFVLNDQDGNEFDLYKNLDKKVLLVFYPKDNTVVCSRQLSNYSSNKSLFERNGITPVGINTASERTHKAFCNNIKMNFPLLSDKDKEISRRFGALDFLGRNKRKLVMINEEKKIIFEKTTLPLFYLGSDKLIKLIKEQNSFK